MKLCVVFFFFCNDAMVQSSLRREEERKMSLLSYPTEGVDVDSTGLFVSWAEVHWSSDQKDISDAILVDIQPTHLTAIVGANLQTGTCNYISLPVDGVISLSSDMRFLQFCSNTWTNENEEEEWIKLGRALPVLHWGPVQCWHRCHCWVQTGWLCLCVWSEEPRLHTASSSPRLSQMTLCSLKTCLHTHHYTLPLKLWPLVKRL